MTTTIVAVIAAVMALIATIFGTGPEERLQNLTQRICPQATIIIEQAGGVVDAAAQAEVQVLPREVWANARAICDYFAPPAE